MAAGLHDRLLPSGAPRPDRRIVHLGMGAFYRAFVCSALAEMGGWGVIGVSLRSPAIRDALAPQDFVFTACELGSDGIRDRVIEVVRDLLVAPEDPAAVIEALASPQTHLVTLTVTEKGYCHDPATGTLNFDHPDIQHDLTNTLPRSAPGFLVRGLQARRDRGLHPFTVLSCDNLSENGRVTKDIVVSLARRFDPKLAEWIEAHGAFPSSMVDRIVPATTKSDIAELEARAGYHDAAPVMHEPFLQWVIQDEFSGERPPLETIGAQMVADVRPFEHMKLRMLNGAHSALAYLGCLAGHQTVAEAVADPVLSAFLRHIWQKEIIPSLEAPRDTDLQDYADALLVRFANPGIRHRTHQIAMDGSQKLPQRLLATIAEGLKSGREVTGLLLAVAAWMRYGSGRDESGTRFAVQDPMADELAQAHEATSHADTVRTLLRLHDVFDAELARTIEPELVQLYQGLIDTGARAMMREVAE